jgi:RNA recognition motif-containing protein
MEIYVGNLTPAITELELKKLFSSHGIVKSVHVITDHHTRQSKCFGYVIMERIKDIAETVKIMHGTEFKKQILVVKEARSREDREGQPW